ncbi:hypothetical protein HPG69_014470 [Diceros bicornis minor]|uniref:KRAB domain-containing protein n=1 Tax=Diceros bicornis minor TaxID=77932 RepID=A0A7J7F9W0_DICBM|nr:hypothetical protein HPG69_014470 [Diceros bicornis minor]
MRLPDRGRPSLGGRWTWEPGAAVAPQIGWAGQWLLQLPGWMVPICPLPLVCLHPAPLCVVTPWAAQVLFQGLLTFRDVAVHFTQEEGGMSGPRAEGPV